jgi:hypothetical protein
MSALSRVYARGPDADALIIGARFYWRGRRHKWFLRLDGYYKMLCCLGFHFLHEFFPSGHVGVFMRTQLHP